MSSESQRSVNDWCNDTFGEGTDSLAAFNRTCEEASEFLAARDPQEMMEEAADVVICFYRLASVLQYDLHDQIDRKMAINRSRQWISHGDGTGHHIK